MIPRVIIHNAISVDGRLKGFVPDMGLYYGIAGSFAEDATLTGADTMLASLEDIGGEPEMGEGSGAGNAESRPLLVVTDSRGRIREWKRFLSWPFWRAGVALCAKSTPAGYLESLKSDGIDVIVAGENRVDLAAALEQLSERYGVETIRADSGGALNGALLRAGLVDEVSILLSPFLAGGEDPLTLFTEPDGPARAGTIGVELEMAERMPGGHVWLRYKVVSETPIN